MRKFVFITHRTPAHLRSTLRADLNEICLQALHAQIYEDWKLLLIGEHESEKGKIKEVAIDFTPGSPAAAEQLEKIYNRDDVKDFIHDSDYLVKIDDDDLISPNILDAVKDLDFDVYFDTHHTFYEISSGCISRQKRPWIPSTCIHKTKQILSPLRGGKNNIFTNSVLYSDHSKLWHVHYEDKIVLYAKPQNPVYLRVLSPDSITSLGLAKQGHLNYGQEGDLSHYFFEYLPGFGPWKRKLNPEFEPYYPGLEKAWVRYSGNSQKPIPSENLIKRVLRRFRHV